MKTLIKVIICLFFGAVAALYIFVPCIEIELGDANVPWNIGWLLLSHCIIGVAIFAVPVTLIFSWIDESMDKRTLQDNLTKTTKDLKNQIEEGIHVK